MWGRRANESLIDWNDSDSETIVAGKHDGYAHLNDPVMHKRELRLDKNTEKISVSDSFVCKSGHTANLYFHFDPACRLKKIDAGTLSIMGPFGEVCFSAPASEIEILKPDNHPGAGWISTGYHQKQASTSVVIRLLIAGDTRHHCEFSLA